MQHMIQDGHDFSNPMWAKLGSLPARRTPTSACHVLRHDSHTHTHTTHPFPLWHLRRCTSQSTCLCALIQYRHLLLALKGLWAVFLRCLWCNKRTKIVRHSTLAATMQACSTTFRWTGTQVLADGTFSFLRTIFCWSSSYNISDILASCWVLVRGTYLLASLKSLSPASSESNMGVGGLKHVWLYPCKYRIVVQPSSANSGMMCTMYVDTKPTAWHEQADNTVQS